MFSKKKTSLGIAVIVVTSACFNGVWTAHSDHLLCGLCVANALRDSATKNFLVSVVFLYVGIPAPVLLALNTLIAVRLRQHMKATAGVTSNVSIPHHRITAMLMSVTTVFLLFVPPIALSHLVSQLLGTNLFATDNKTIFVVGQTAQLLFEVRIAYL